MERKELLKLIKNVELTKKEKRVAEFFLDEENRVYLMTASEIATELALSETSVIRFIKSIGFKNFTEFKNNGQQKMKTGLNNKTNEFIKNISLIKDGSLEKLYLNKINEEINRIFTKNSLNKLQNIGKAIIESKKKYVIGFKSAAGIANFLGIRLGFMLKEVHTFNAADTMVINSLYDIEQEDLLVLFDYPMYSKTAKILVKIAKERKSKIILFTDSENSPLASQVDILYKVKLNGLTIFNSLISTQIIIEYILNYISQFIEEKEKSRFTDIRKYLIEKLWLNFIRKNHK